MKYRRRNWFNRRWVIAWFVAASVLLVISVSFAAYTNFNSVKRVVSTKSDSEPLFSSNLLNLETSDAVKYRYRQVTPNINDGNATFILEIHNYQLHDVTTFNQKTIVYDLIATLQPQPGTDLTGQFVNFKIAETSFNNETLTLTNESLAGGGENTNTYLFTIPAEYKDKVNIQIEAVPNNSSYDATKQQKLAAIVTMTEIVVSKTWTGEFIDTERSINDYDGFNYEISGNGQGTVTLKWKSDMLQISPWSAKQLSNSDPTRSTDSDGEWSTLDFSVGNPDQPTAYQLQFFKKSTIDSWEMLKTYVSVSFSEANQE